jgi:hypothetical protein
MEMKRRAFMASMVAAPLVTAKPEVADYAIEPTAIEWPALFNEVDWDSLPPAPDGLDYPEGDPAKLAAMRERLYSDDCPAWFRRTR